MIMKPSFSKLEKCHQLSRNRENFGQVFRHMFLPYIKTAENRCPKFAKNIWKSKLWKSLMICKRLIMAGKYIRIVNNLFHICYFFRLFISSVTIKARSSFPNRDNTPSKV